MGRFARALLGTTSALAVVVSAQTAGAQTQVVLSTLWETKNTTDYLTSTTPSERDMFAVRGAVAYLPAATDTGRAALNRLYWGAALDHMDSIATSEGSYSLEGPLGYPWTSPTAVPGLAQLARLTHGVTGDHVTIIDGDSIAGYGSQTNFGRFAYPRYLNTAEVLNSLTAGGVTIKSNNVAGGSIWSWVWNGTEFIDHQDYGRELQAAVFYNFNGVIKNPTEAGSIHSTAALQPFARQGSPLVESYNSGNTQITASVPLEWEPANWGGSASQPVIYSDMKIGKEITLNYNNMGPVALYITKVTTGSSISAGNIEVPTGYMPSSFTRFYTYDAVSQTLTEVYPPSCNSVPVIYTPSSGYGGVIISNSTQTRAMAIYGRSRSVSNGYVDQFQLFDFVACQGTSKWNAVHSANTISSGLNSYRSFVMTGTISDVQGYMRTLYVNGDY